MTEDSALAYQCKICKKRFQHSSALGGHISKAHPGQSSAYNHKKRVRETRELERELHRHTMRIYQQSVAQQQEGRAQTQTQLNRNTIKRIKKTLVLRDAQYESLRTKFLGQQHPPTPCPESEKKARKPREDPFLEQVVQSELNRDTSLAEERRSGSQLSLKPSSLLPQTCEVGSASAAPYKKDSMWAGETSKKKSKKAAAAEADEREMLDQKIIQEVCMMGFERLRSQAMFVGPAKL